MIEIGSGPAAFVAGFTASCGVLLVLAGASKIYRAARGPGGGSAIRRALRMTRRRWRRVELVAGGLECAVGVVVCAGRDPAIADAAMAGLGAVFCALTGYARIRRVPGGCGCLEWRSPARRAAQPVARRDVARAALVLAGGVLGAVLARGPVFGGSVFGGRTFGAAFAGGPALAFDDMRFVAGALVAGTVLVLVSVHAAPRTPVCHRGLWFPARATLRALTRHAVFGAMAESAGPFGPVVHHRRAGCADEFWFTPAPRPGPAASPADTPAHTPAHTPAASPAGAVVFLASYPGPGGALAVQASLRAGPAAAEALRPVRFARFRGLGSVGTWPSPPRRPPIAATPGDPPASGAGHAAVRDIFGRFATICRLNR